MKKLSAAALAVALLTAGAAQADTNPGWYMGAGLGGTLQFDSDTRIPTGTNRIFYKPGWNVNANGGYAWTNGLRLEGEVYHSRSNVEAIRGTGGGNGHLNNTDFFANAFYDFQLGMRMTPYIGGGVGVALVNADDIGTLNNGSRLNDDQTEFAYQAIVGVAGQLDPHWTVSADYRFIGTTEPNFRTTTGANARTENYSHNIVFGLRYNFGQPKATPVVKTSEPPAPKPRPVAKPEVVPVPQNYMVFFDFDRSDITPEAKRILASAAQDFKKGGSIRVVVTGHTDTMGTPEYNQKLSDRRAKAVKAELGKLGVDGDKISTRGAGESDLMVPTNDQVREAQNRRAEIVFERK